MLIFKNRLCFDIKDNIELYIYHLRRLCIKLESVKLGSQNWVIDRTQKFDIPETTIELPAIVFTK